MDERKTHTEQIVNPSLEDIHGVLQNTEWYRNLVKQTQGINIPRNNWRRRKAINDSIRGALFEQSAYVYLAHHSLSTLPGRVLYSPSETMSYFENIYKDMYPDTNVTVNQSYFSNNFNMYYCPDGVIVDTNDSSVMAVCEYTLKLPEEDFIKTVTMNKHRRLQKLVWNQFFQENCWYRSFQDSKLLMVTPKSDHSIVPIGSVVNNTATIVHQEAPFTRDEFNSFVHDLALI